MLFDTVEFLSPQSTIVNPVVQGEIKQTEVTAPTSPESTVSKQYVDDGLANKASLNQDQTFEAKQTFDGGLVVTNEVQEVPLVTNVSGTYAINLSNGTLFDLTMTGNVTFTFPSAVAGKQFTILLNQDGTGNHVPTWPDSVRWSGSTAPTVTNTAGKTDILSFLAVGTYWLGFINAQNFTRA